MMFIIIRKPETVKQVGSWHFHQQKSQHCLLTGKPLAGLWWGYTRTRSPTGASQECKLPTESLSYSTVNPSKSAYLCWVAVHHLLENVPRGYTLGIVFKIFDDFLERCKQVVTDHCWKLLMTMILLGKVQCAMLPTSMQLCRWLQHLPQSRGWRCRFELRTLKQALMCSGDQNWGGDQWLELENCQCKICLSP